MNRTPSSSGHGVPLADALRTLRLELQAEPLPPLRPRATAVAAPVIAPAAATAGGRSVAARRWPWAAGWAWAGTVACIAVLLASAWLMNLPRVPSAQEMPRLSGFLPVAPLEQWARPDGGADAAWLVNTELPNDQLAAFGLPFDPARAGETVRAQLLMRPSGEVLAVRLVR